MRTVLLGIVLLMSIGSCENKPSSPVPEKNALQQTLEKPNTVILDVRHAEEYESGHVPGAVLLPVDEVESSVQQLIADKTTPVVVHCAKGSRSARAAKTMKNLGYTLIIDGKNTGCRCRRKRG